MSLLNKAWSDVEQLGLFNVNELKKENGSRCNGFHPQPCVRLCLLLSNPVLPLTSCKRGWSRSVSRGSFSVFKSQMLFNVQQVLTSDSSAPPGITRGLLSVRTSQRLRTPATSGLGGGGGGEPRSPNAAARCYTQTSPATQILHEKDAKLNYQTRRKRRKPSDFFILFYFLRKWFPIRLRAESQQSKPFAFTALWLGCVFMITENNYCSNIFIYEIKPSLQKLVIAVGCVC